MNKDVWMNEQMNSFCLQKYGKYLKNTSKMEWRSKSRRNFFSHLHTIPTAYQHSWMNLKTKPEWSVVSQNELWVIMVTYFPVNAGISKPLMILWKKMMISLLHFLLKNKFYILISSKRRKWSILKDMPIFLYHTGIKR